MNRKLLVGAIGLASMIVVAAPPVAAFHGAWWKAQGTATDPDGLAFNVEYFWGGQDAILACTLGSCTGEGDGRLTIQDVAGLSSVSYPIVALEDPGPVSFVTMEFCPGTGNVEILPEYAQTFTGGELSGVMRNCLSSGMNNNDFTGSYLAFALVLHSEGGFGVSHG